MPRPEPGRDQPSAVVDGLRVLPQRAPEPRVWRGIPHADRVSERRARLLEAGLEVFGTVGVREATVSAVCAQAHLTQRYFYESFPSLQALLADVFTSVTDAQHERLTHATLQVREAGGDLSAAARAALVVYFSDLQADPRVARVQLFEILGGDQHTARCYQASIRRAADLVLIVTGLREVSRPAVPRLLALGLIGAVVEIATMWLLSGFADSLDTVVGSALVIFDAVIKAEVLPAGERSDRSGHRQQV